MHGEKRNTRDQFTKWLRNTINAWQVNQSLVLREERERGIRRVPVWLVIIAFLYVPCLC